MSDDSITTSPNKIWAVCLGPLLFITCSFFPSPLPDSPLMMIMIGITAWVALWWLTEAVHIAVSSFIPFILLPASGIVDIKEVSAQYMDPILFLFIGGFLLAFAIEKWGLHRRLALGILSSTGHNASRVLFGIMLSGFLISMWISNTATVMMLLSAVLAVIHQLKIHISVEETHRKVASALLIGLAYSASIGGLATLVGTPTNMIFYRAYNEQYATSAPITFAGWMIVALPFAFLLLLSAWFIIRFFLLRKLKIDKFEMSGFKTQFSQLGRWNKDEKIVGAVFLSTALLWLTRADLDIGSFHLTGWTHLFPYPTQIQDSTIAITMALLLFIIPSQTEKGRALLTWKEASKLPYEIILLFGSGFALAKGFELSGLSNWLANHLNTLNEVPILYTILIICVIVTVISEFASNVASIQLMMPILISLQLITSIDPKLLLMPAAFSASLGFMLPIATAPNTIAFSSGHIRVKEMVTVGFFVDLIGILLILIFSNWM
jgi:solute carrier family 13 (sodium-dependent dicarboxylate transporter), member 2/3/5